MSLLSREAVVKKRSFGFLDLPVDLRLMVYECLLYPDRHRIRIPHEKDLFDVTLISAAPIPPVHLACKTLYKEVVSCLPGKVQRMGLSRTAPRVIIEAGHLQALIAFVQQLLDILTSPTHKPWNSSIVHTEGGHEPYHCGSTFDRQFSTHFEALSAFCMNAKRHLSRTLGLSRSWWEQAEEILDPLHTQRYYKIQSPSEVVQRVAKQLAGLPDAKYTTLQILVFGEDRDGFSQFYFIREVQHKVDLMTHHFSDVRPPRVHVYTDGPTDDTEVQPYSSAWLCYRGELSREALAEEWI